MDNKNIFEYWALCLTKNYANFSGRARRKEYWSLVLLFLICFFSSLFLTDYVGEDANGFVLFGIFAFFFLPIISAAVRRLHDIGKKGTMLLVYFIPLIGGLWVLVLLLTESDYGTNRYGRNPKKHYIESEIDEIGLE